MLDTAKVHRCHGYPAGGFSQMFFDTDPVRLGVMSTTAYIAFVSGITLNVRLRPKSI